MNAMDGAAATEQLEPAALAARAELACATFELCTAYLDLHRQSWDADARGAPLGNDDKARLVDEVCQGQMAAFASAWLRGRGFEENMQVADTAARRFAAIFQDDEPARQGVERWMLDFVREYGSDVARRLTETGSAMLIKPELAGLTTALGALLWAWRAPGATSRSPDLLCALEAVRAAVGDALARGYGATHIQAMLSYWTETNDGPRVTVQMQAAARTGC